MALSTRRRSWCHACVTLVCRDVLHLCHAQVGPQGKAYGIEHVPELVSFARANMEKSAEGRQMLSEGRVVLVQGDGRLGLPVS
eukprot:6257366-Pyramimonas_sp.AAC.1